MISKTSLSFLVLALIIIPSSTMTYNVKHDFFNNVVLAANSSSSFPSSPQTSPTSNNNTNFINPNSANATNILDINKTISNTTAYPLLSMFLAKHKLSELPIPSAERMFTPDKATIMRVYQDPLILEMTHLLKNLIAGQPSTFILNLFYKNATWLWHSDLDISIKKADTGQMILSMPNTHGHGSMVQFSPVFPSPGIYDISIIYGQQINSPNYIKPHYVNQANFQVNVQQQQQQSPVINQAAKMRGENMTNNRNMMRYHPL